jgi:hypothetical protein
MQVKKEMSVMFTRQMKNSMKRWDIPYRLGNEILERDTKCVYCGVTFGSKDVKGSSSSWEHIVNDCRIVTRENIARCCRSCNSSKGAKPLAEWFGSAFCGRRKINRETVAEVVKQAIENPPSFSG